MNQPVALILIIILAAVGYWLYVGQQTSLPQPVGSDPKNATYEIDGSFVTLRAGTAETSIAGSTSKTVTQYFGNEAMGDLDSDGSTDIAFILTQSSGGSGTFYYVVAALKKGNSYQGTNAILLGDRVAPQTTQIRNGELVVSYATRKSDEPMTAQPSVGISKTFSIIGGRLQDR
ncbi:hypothetical protein A3A38_03690 [Candidatus Kaiserbacteria bacterium RIFCSPLOWO2_01_FULL_53_17]|uniref:VCBS repeat-containing protein n=1 Tax=Candidatus Kaiserbacteria bacterium RIFCSPLOWO2_01_FULL_53_17 TaxID=1798511 RepID=A0A1F6EGH4_9BACT|nr:MAG: hypothetical protein A3A38_03690 [Candidatus Kaiserbacteria bacterium RIFCSPLOWO2_01_FULL_53_17]